MITQICTKCNIEKPLSEFYIRKETQKHRTGCKDCQANYTKNRWPGYKEMCVEYKGGCCESCGYNKYIGALEFHHIDPSKKDFQISKRVSMSIVKVKAELDKCAMLCANCHREAHANMLEDFVVPV